MSEKFYDDEIAPALLSLSQRCQENGLSFLAVVEWGLGEYGRTVNFQPNSGFGIRLVDVAAQAWGNVDALIFAIMKYVSKHGHSSACLSILSVPTDPRSGEGT